MKKVKNKYAEMRGGELTTAPVPKTIVNNAESADWMRLCRAGQRLWGMSRTTWNELCDSGKVKSITLRKRYATRGIKLIYRPSAEAYLKSLLDSKETQQ